MGAAYSAVGGREYAVGRHDLLTIDEAAALLRVSRSTIYRECKAGRLTIVKVRGRSRVPRWSLQDYMAQAERDATPPRGVPVVVQGATVADLEA